MKRFVSACLLLLLMGGCEENSKPKDLLSEDEMVNVLIDIHLTEGIASSLPIPYDSSQVIYNLLENEVFVEHEVQDSVFTKSMIYYLQDPATMDRIYGRVVDSLVVRESSGGIEDKF
ncbi:MAG: DUF4296 domain-containing protein [Algoriphagus sp.]|nr:DUF4296 domain-containing protein [Algoriphagus sp.]